MKVISALIALIFIFEQTALADQPARAQLDLVQAAALLESSTDLTQKADTVDGVLANQAQGLASQESDEAGLESFQAGDRTERVHQRWKRIFTKNAPHALNRLQTEVAKLSDEEADAQVKRSMNAGLKSSNPAIIAASQQLADSKVDSRTLILSNFKNAQPAMIEGLSTSIAQAGGIVPFMFHLRSEISKQKAKVQALQKSGASRSLASEECSVALSILVLIGVLVVFLGGIALAGLFITATSILVSVVIPLGIIFAAGELEGFIITSSGCFRKNPYAM